MFLDEMVATQGGRVKYSQGEDLMRQMPRVAVATAELLSHLRLARRPDALAGEEAEMARVGLETTPVGALPWSSSLCTDTLGHYMAEAREQLALTGEGGDSSAVTGGERGEGGERGLVAEGEGALMGSATASMSVGMDEEGYPQDADSRDARGTAAALLLCFLGASLGSSFSLR